MFAVQSVGNVSCLPECGARVEEGAKSMPTPSSIQTATTEATTTAKALDGPHSSSRLNAMDLTRLLNHDDNRSNGGATPLSGADGSRPVLLNSHSARSRSPNTAAREAREATPPACPLQTRIVPTPTSKRSVCTFCKKGFQCDSLKRKHEAKHTKPHKCTIAGCTRGNEGFTSKNDLARHVNSVHKHRAVGYNCQYELCKDKRKIYYRLDNFRNHLKKIHYKETSHGSFPEFIKRAEQTCRHEGTLGQDTMSESGSESISHRLEHATIGSESESSYSIDTSDISTVSSVEDYRSQSGQRDFASLRGANENTDPMEIDRDPEPFLQAAGLDVHRVPSLPPRKTGSQKKEILDRLQQLDTRKAEIEKEQAALRLQLEEIERNDTEGSGLRSPELSLSSLNAGPPTPHTLDGRHQAGSISMDRFIHQPESDEPSTVMARHMGSPSSGRDPRTGDRPGNRTGVGNYTAMQIDRTQLRSPPTTPPDDKSINLYSANAIAHGELTPSSPGPSIFPRSPPAVWSPPPQRMNNRKQGYITPAGSTTSTPMLQSVPAQPIRNIFVPLQASVGPTNKPQASRKRAAASSLPRPPRLPPGTVVKKFPCPVDGCKSSFDRPSELKKHDKRHNRPYGCTLRNCGKSFGSKSDWIRHENGSHEKVDLWKCTLPKDSNPSALCGKMVFRRENFTNHLKSTAHGIRDKAELTRLCDKCYIGGSSNHKNFWCGFCVNPRTDRPGTTVLLNGGGWSERNDHIATHFEQQKSIRDYVYDDADQYSDCNKSDNSDEGERDGEGHMNGIAVLADVATKGYALPRQKSRRMHDDDHNNSAAGPPDNPGDEHELKRKEPALQPPGSAAPGPGQDAMIWFCCSAGCMIPGPYTVNVYASCQSCSHQRCNNCNVEAPPPLPLDVHVGA